MDFIVPEAAEEFQQDSDADLLTYMSMRAEDPVMATAAYAEFYTRHVRWLYALLMRSESQRLLGGRDAVREFVQDTFQKAFSSAATFDPAGIADHELLRKRARAWLGTIGNNLMADALRERIAEEATDIENREDLHPVEDYDGEPTGEEFEAMRDLVDELSEREKDIIFEWTLNYKPGATHQRLPNDVSQALARRWATTPTNIRVIRNRTFERLKNEIGTRLAARRTEKHR